MYKLSWSSFPGKRPDILHTSSKLQLICIQPGIRVLQILHNYLKIVIRAPTPLEEMYL